MGALLAAMRQGASGGAVAGRAGAPTGGPAAEGGAAEPADMAAPMDDLLFFADKEGDTTVFGRCVCKHSWLLLLFLASGYVLPSMVLRCLQRHPVAAARKAASLPLDSTSACSLPPLECRDWQMGSEEEDEEEGGEAGAAGLHLQDLPGSDEQAEDRRRSVSLGSE